MCVIRHPDIISAPIQCLLSFSFQVCFRFLNNVIQRPFIGVSWRYQIIWLNIQKNHLMIRQQVFFCFFPKHPARDDFFPMTTRNAININDLVNEYLLTFIFQGYLSNKTKNSSRNVLIYWIFFLISCSLCLTLPLLPKFAFIYFYSKNIIQLTPI